jgi:hypothetical protein
LGEEFGEVGLGWALATIAINLQSNRVHAGSGKGR